MWLQEVDEQVRTDSGVKAGGFDAKVQHKFTDGFTIVESDSSHLQNVQLHFCKAQDVIACTKASNTCARNDARFNCVCSGILIATEANDVIDRDVAAAPQTPQLGGAQANFGGPS